MSGSSGRIQCRRACIGAVFAHLEGCVLYGGPNTASQRRVVKLESVCDSPAAPAEKGARRRSPCAVKVVAEGAE